MRYFDCGEFTDLEFYNVINKLSDGTCVVKAERGGKEFKGIFRKNKLFVNLYGYIRRLELDV